MSFPILFGTTVTTVLHYRADCDACVNASVPYSFVIMHNDAQDCKGAGAIKMDESN